jgi:predicted nucleotidyltransferase component of viral defense system
VSSVEPPRRTWGHAFALEDLLNEYDGGRVVAERDFALLTLAGHLAAHFPGQLVFKGGFVLRHVHGVQRFSEDVDATRHAPARAQFDADEVARVIRDASETDIVRFNPQPPATDSRRSLDFDKVSVTGSMLLENNVQVEISYREEVSAPPQRTRIGPPFYAEFEVLAMAVPEMAAEKMRALAQRVVVTDLADLAELLERDDCPDEAIAKLAAIKFEQVKQGVANREKRILENIEQMGADYDDVVPAYFPGAKSYADAAAIVWSRIKDLIP